MAYDIAITTGLVGIALVFAYISVNIEKKHPILQYLFLFLSMGTILLTFGAMTDISVSGGYSNITTITSSGYTVSLWVLVFLVLYVIITFLINASKAIGGVNDQAE